MHRKTAHVIKFEIEALAREFGLENLGFLTLTFREKVYDIKEANRRFKSLATNILAKRYRRAVVALERHQDGAIHFHLVVVVDSDIRTGLDFDEIANATLPKSVRYRSANATLKAEWKFWRDEDRGGEGTAKAYGFGRVETLPIRTTAEGIASYVGSYIGKHISQRRPEDKGARLVRFIGYKPSDRKASNKFSWASPGAFLWRAKLAAVAKEAGIEDMSEFTKRLGPCWAKHCAESIMSFDLATLPGGFTYPNATVARMDGHDIPQEAGDGPVTITKNQIQKRQFNGDPIWAIYDPHSRSDALKGHCPTNCATNPLQPARRSPWQGDVLPDSVTPEPQVSNLRPLPCEGNALTGWEKYLASPEGEDLAVQCARQRKQNSYQKLRKFLRTPSKTPI